MSGAVSFAHAHSPLSDTPEPQVKKTVQQLLAEYGKVAVFVYFTIFFAVLAGFWLAIRLGFQPSSTAGTAGSLAAAYIATKVTQPVRIAATLVATPVVAKIWEKVRGRKRGAAAETAH